MGDSDKSERNHVPNKSVILFGRDVSKIPCFRSTLLNGVMGGIGCGLSYFLFTSRVKTAADVAVYSFTLISLGYWVHCRYNYGKTKYEMMRLQEALQRTNVYKGSEMERNLDATEKVDV